MKAKNLVLITGILFFLCLAIYEGFYKPHHLIKNGVLLNAKTIEWVSSAKMRMDLRYEFKYKGRLFIDDNATNFRGNINFINRYFPVMYDPKLGRSELLIEPSDFKKFGMPFPDSQHWVLNYLK